MRDDGFSQRRHTSPVGPMLRGPEPGADHAFRTVHEDLLDSYTRSRFPHTQHEVAIITLKNRSLSSATQFFVDRVRAMTRAVNQNNRPMTKRGNRSKSPA